MSLNVEPRHLDRFQVLVCFPSAINHLNLVSMKKWLKTNIKYDIKCICLLSHGSNGLGFKYPLPQSFGTMTWLLSMWLPINEHLIMSIICCGLMLCYRLPCMFVFSPMWCWVYKHPKSIKQYWTTSILLTTKMKGVLGIHFQWTIIMNSTHMDQISSFICLTINICVDYFLNARRTMGPLCGTIRHWQFGCRAIDHVHAFHFRGASL